MPDSEVETNAGIAMAKRRLENFTGRDPGWYALGTNPNEQSYWDGEAFTGVRHWVGGQGWVEDDQTPASRAPLAQESIGAVRTPQMNFGRRATDQPSFTFGVLLLMSCGIALMFGSLGTWIRAVSALNLPVSINGTDVSVSSLIGTNGWVTFVAGIVLLVFAGLAISSNEGTLVRLTALASVITLIFAVYDMFRTIQKIHNHPETSVGWGLICVLSAAVLATLIAVTRLVKSR
jgi:hypothetical protein